jgi:hypothetical protein
MAIGDGERHMIAGQEGTRRWTSRTIEIKVWKIFAALIILPILVMWFMVVHQNDEILALVRNDVVTDVAGQRMWSGTFVNTNEKALRDVAVVVDFLDSQDRTVAKADARTIELPFSNRLELQTRLPPDAVKLRIYSVQWRMGDTAALMGPFRNAWEFGYVMTDPGKFNH